MIRKFIQEITTASTGSPGYKSADASGKYLGRFGELGRTSLTAQRFIPSRKQTASYPPPLSSSSRHTISPYLINFIPKRIFLFYSWDTSAHQNGPRPASPTPESQSSISPLYYVSPPRIYLTHSAPIQADKALSGASGGFNLFGGRTEKYENAADLYSQAANAFRVQKMSMSYSSIKISSRSIN